MSHVVDFLIYFSCKWRIRSFWSIINTSSSCNKSWRVLIEVASI